MNYWIYVTNSENWAITKKTNILGVSVRNINRISRVKNGDKCLVYVRSEIQAGEKIGPKIVAEYEVVTPVFEDSKKIFIAPQTTPSETFPLRLILKHVRVFEAPIEFKPLVPKLSFLPNKKYWTGPIRGRAIVQIPESDYDTIISNA